jgi:hypothetical protein
MAISSKLTSRPRSCEFALLNFRFARHLHTMRSSQGIERIFAETPELISPLKGERKCMMAGPKPEPGSGEADYSPRKAMQLHKRVLLKIMESRHMSIR